MEKFFKFKERGTNLKTELIAGITTFLTMAYILAVNPGILSVAGMDFGSVFTATALSAAVATLVMALIANLPFALAPGMGLNAFLAFTVVLGMGHTWQFALTAVLVEGIIFILLTLFNIREAIVNSIPTSLKKAITVGIGLFIAFIGFHNGGVIVGNPATLVGLGKIAQMGPALLTTIGVIVIMVLLVLKVKGAILIGIFITTIIGIPFGITTYAGGNFLPPSLAPTFWKFEFARVLSLDFLIVLFTFLFVDMFDTVGTLIGCATKAKMIVNDEIPNCKEALLADAIGTVFGAILGTSTVTTYVESASGVAEGGRTGFTALVVGILFLISLFLAPLFLSIPAPATAGALVIVGFYMMSPVVEINFEDPTEGIPAFLTIILMMLTFSIADGIMFGVLSYVLLKLIKRDFKAITVPTIIIAVLFLLKIIVG